MTLAIMQPYFFPYLGYFQLLNCVDKFVVYDDVNYIKRGWINRNRILLNAGPHMITVPVKKASQNSLINQLYVDVNDKWIDRTLQSIDHAYRKAPMFSQVFWLVEDCLKHPDHNLAKFNLNALIAIKEYLGIDTEIIASSNIYNNQHLKGSERILDICLSEKASMYVNPPGGRHLYQEEAFNKFGIDLRFINSLPYKYDQSQPEFIELLSIIDVLMLTSVKETRNLPSKFRLT